MSHVYPHMHDYDTPEQAMAALKRQRTLKLVVVMVGLTLALVAAIGASALMYADEPQIPPSTQSN